MENYLCNDLNRRKLKHQMFVFCVNFCICVFFSVPCRTLKASSAGGKWLRGLQHPLLARTKTFINITFSNNTSNDK